MNNSPIGIFDSGVGGLSVFSKLVKMLPEEEYIYFGDTLNLPYGSKTKEQLIKITKKIFDFFDKRKVKAVVMACNTTSATVYDILKNEYDYKIYPITQNAARQIASEGYKNIGVFATSATVNSHIYKREIQAYDSNINVYEIACLDWVNIVENSLQNDIKSIENIKKNVENMLINRPEKIILGCTHFPYLTNVLSKFASADIFIDPAEYFVKHIVSDLEKQKLLCEKYTTEPKFYVSSNPSQFIKAAKLFYNVKNAEEISPAKI